MSDLTDLEICKRIADIEQVDCYYDENSTYVNYWPYEGAPVQKYNPLTDKALCFDLMVKYRVGLFICGNGGWQAECEFYKPTKCKNPQKAICLAIIEKHEAKNNE